MRFPVNCRHALVALVYLAVLSGGAGLQAADEAGLTHLVPSGGQQGKTVEVVLRGTLNGADSRRAWVSHPGLSVAFGKKSDRVEAKGSIPQPQPQSGPDSHSHSYIVGKKRSLLRTGTQERDAPELTHHHRDQREGEQAHDSDPSIRSQFLTNHVV